MIKFFRKIRYNLMEQNKTSKYFKYAIGEIILVVIGILIALQINTWNQKRIDKNQEREVITKLHKDFKENKKNLKGFIISNKNEMNANKELMNLIGASKEELIKHNLDSLFYVYFGANELAFADNTLKT
jgi:predicted small secreted protein